MRTLSSAIFVVIIGLLCALSVGISAQDAPLPLNSPSEQLMERMLLWSPSAEIHSAIKPYDRKDVFTKAYTLADTLFPILPISDLMFLLAENDEYYPLYHLDSVPVSPLLARPPESVKPLLNIFYKRPAHFFSVDEPDFFLRVNPILHGMVGDATGTNELLYINRRGIELRGGIDRKVFFTTNIIEAQLRPPSYVERFVQSYNALPDAGLYKNFEGRFFTGDGQYDYLTSNGCVGVHVLKHISIQLGHGKNFIGDGYRSLFLSDFAKNYFYLKFNTRVWKFHYQNLFTELSAREKLPGNTLVPKKYMTAHYLSFKASRNVTLGLFESVVFGREENQFELQYLNPVILYRSIEHHVGSPDNVLIGLSATWDIQKRVRLYSQFIVDEFKFSEFFSSRNWWGNKHGLQLGAFYTDALGIRNLDVRLELNRVRPFTYSHYDSLGSYAHFNQPLAHPLGANFNEVLAKLDYRPLPRLYLTGMVFNTLSGGDTDSIFYGENILRSNLERNSEFGVEQRQGIPQESLTFLLRASFMFKHNIFVEATYFRRDFSSERVGDDLLTQYLSLGVRWNYYTGGDLF